MANIMEILEAKGYKIDFSQSLFYGLRFEDGTIDTTWILWILHPRDGYLPTLVLEEEAWS